MPRAPGLHGGQPLPVAARARLSAQFGVDLEHVRVHTGREAADRAREQRADAYTQGADIVFGEHRYAPGTRAGERLLAHELAHVVQQTAPGAAGAGELVQARTLPGIARSPDQWLRGSVDVRTLSYTELVDEADELTQWLDRQMESNDDTQIIEQAIEALRNEVNRRNRAASAPASSAGRGRRGRRARAAAAESAEAPAADAAPDRYPRVLIEMTSVHYEDTAEMREEYDLIMRWLVRPEISAAQRSMLEGERANLEPQFHTDRERVVRERHTARVREALRPSDPEAANAVVEFARTIEGISGEPGNPNVFYIYHGGERVAISREQAESLRTELVDRFSNAGRAIEGRATYYWERYHDQVRINEHHYVVSTISGWLADVDDPRVELTNRYTRLQARLDVMRDYLSNEQMVQFAQSLPAAEALAQEIRMLARAFYEGYIEGAERAITALEFTRNAAFALEAAILAVVAAPFVAGAVAATGATGVLATGMTMAGTGTVVAGSMATLRGGSTALGTAAAGGSLEEVAEAGLAEAEVGAREGFIAGAGGAAGRGLGLLAEGMSTGSAIATRVIGEMAIAGMSAVVEVLLRHDMSEWSNDAVIDEAAFNGAVAAVSAAPGGFLGSSSSQAVRRYVAPFVAGCTTYVAMRVSGGTHAQALANAVAAVASAAAMGRAGGGDELDVAMEARGRATVEAIGDTARTGTRTVATGLAAIMTGTADAMPPLRSGFGGTAMSVADVDVMPSLGAPAAHLADMPPDVDLPSPVRPAAPEESTLPTAPAHATTEEAMAALDADLGRGPAVVSTATTLRGRHDEAHAASTAAGWTTSTGDPTPGGPVHLVVGEHGHATHRRAAAGVTGAARESAHLGATSFLRSLPGYSRESALTTLLPRAAHRSFDNHWKAWVRGRRAAISAAGSSDYTATLAEMLHAERLAIRQATGLTPEMRATAEWMIEQEFVSFATSLPDRMETRVPLPAIR